MSSLFNHGYALLIGVGATATPRWSLPVTVKDVQALQSILTNPELCAYPNAQVRLLHDAQATHQNILEGLAWLKEQAAADAEATVIVYYSGHGTFDLATSQYYLLQHDFKPNDLVNTALSAQDFTTALRQIQAKRLLVIIDSCHAEGMATAKAGEALAADFLATALPKGFVDELKQGEGRAVFTSSRGQQSSWIRPDGTMSIYTYHLIEALQGAANQPGDTVVRISNLMNHLGKTVQESTRTMRQAEQTPFFDYATEDFTVALLRGSKGVASSSQQVLPKIISNQEVVHPALAMARRSLQILEEQAAGFGKFHIPPHLRLE
ncbi:MAG: caspase family protein, partial [Coleofasciculaceae cyanobacterium]